MGNPQQLEDDLGISLGDDSAPTIAAPAIAPMIETPTVADRYVVIDTEGSGLFDFKRPADDVGQPRLAELTMLYVAPDLTIEREFHAYIKPEDWVMDPLATAVNNLTTEFLLANGVPVAQVLDEFERAIVEVPPEGGRIVVAHNVQHDLKHIRAEFRRAGRNDLFELTRNICTMRGLMGRGVKKADGKGGFPKLLDACAHFRIEESEELHTATGDARRCYRVFCNMHALGWLPEAKVHYAKNKE